MTWLQIIDASPRVKPDPSIGELLSVHGNKLIYLKSNAYLRDSFRYCTNVLNWDVTGNDAEDWVSASFPLVLHV